MSEKGVEHKLAAMLATDEVGYSRLSLGVIRGIGIAVEDRLCRAGIKSCRQLVDTSPSQIREILGYLAQGSDIERWIEQARELIREHAL